MDDETVLHHVLRPPVVASRPHPGSRWSGRAATRMEHVLDSRSVPVAAALLRATRGRVARLWHRKVLVLTTTGRRSGRSRTVVVQYFPDGDDVVVVAANSGMSSHPAWYLNLSAEPRALVEIDGRSVAVRARELTEEEASSFWPRVLAQAPDYERYPSRTDRRIPLVRLVLDHPPEPVGRPAPIVRASGIDLMQLASATTPAAGQVGAVLLLEPGNALDLAELRRSLDFRVRGVPRLRQRLRSTPPGCGRPIWVDDPAFDIDDHVGEASCPTATDRDAVLRVAADLFALPLSRDRPMWSATLLHDGAHDASAVVVRFHHVMADGVGGLAVLAGLVDGARPPTADGFPRPAPTTRSLLVDAARTRSAAVSRVGELADIVRAAVTELGDRPPRAPRCSLNRPVGPRRCLAVVTTDLDAVRAGARGHGVSVNDAMLAAIGSALTRFLGDRGERVDHLVAAVPVSGRSGTTSAELGNQIGVMTVRLPGLGPPVERVRAVAAVTRARRRSRRGASAAVLAPAFRLLAAFHLLRWSTEHQRMVNTFVTNLRGPDTEVRFLDRTVVELIPVNSTSGNVRVAFGVSSYAGTLSVTVVADDSLRDDLDALVDHLRTEVGRAAALSS